MAVGIVKGEDQLHSYKGRIQQYKTALNDSGGDQTTFVYSDAVPSGEVWHVTWIAWRTNDSGIGWPAIGWRSSGTTERYIKIWVSGEWWTYAWHGVHTDIWLEAGEKVWASGNDLADTKRMYLVIYGHKMSKAS